MKLTQTEMPCPFCGASVPCLYTPSAKTIKKSVTATFGSKTNISYTAEKYEATMPCPKCGKSAKEIQNALKHGIEDPDKDKRILDRLRAQGVML